MNKNNSEYNANSFMHNPSLLAEAILGVGSALGGMVVGIVASNTVDLVVDADWSSSVDSLAGITVGGLATLVTANWYENRTSRQ